MTTNRERLLNRLEYLEHDLVNRRADLERAERRARATRARACTLGEGVDYVERELAKVRAELAAELGIEATP